MPLLDPSLDDGLLFSRLQPSMRVPWELPTTGGSESVSPSINRGTDHSVRAHSKNTPSRSQSSNGLKKVNVPANNIPTFPDKDSPLDERFNHVLESAKMVGFENFDEMVTVYYTAKFEESSSLSSEQRLSRMRRLPGLISAVRDNLDGWTPWEKQGCQNEILQSAEHILGSEYSSFIQKRSNDGNDLHMNGLSDDAQHPYNTLNGQDDISTLPGLNEMSNKIQEQVRS